MDIIKSGNHYYYLHAPNVRVSDEDCKRCHISNKGVTPRCKSQAVTDIIESIALQEIELAHIINVEGEKIQRGIALATNIDELISLDSTVNQTLTNVIKIQMLLHFKLEEIRGQT
ncbi:hypothetical protein [Clostridium lacusfryxellense]|uniref:hypothetical protein n=1 Tax=Clostridium lacusfryxellense TaxID=205328 RepID=UPI001C0B5DB3|nr:hypothetical protein [Clostridium lacusfryxellense]MBU3110041.1 hypothetical protein [Clostridium lacusfryxellense]